MREHHLQTPKREQHHLANHRSKSISERNPQKISKKCLSSAFTSVSDVSLKSTKSSMEFSSLSEVSDDNQLGDSAESFIAPVNPALSFSSETVALSDFTPMSSVDESGNFSFKRSGSFESNSSKIGSMEAEMVVNHLRKALIEVLNSSTVDLQSKKLLDALIKVLIEDLFSLPEEQDWFAKLVSTKVHIVFLSISLWILAILITFFYCFGTKSTLNEPPPT